MQQTSPAAMLVRDAGLAAGRADLALHTPARNEYPAPPSRGCPVMASSFEPGKCPFRNPSSTHPSRSCAAATPPWVSPISGEAAPFMPIPSVASLRASTATALICATSKSGSILPLSLRDPRRQTRWGQPAPRSWFRGGLALCPGAVRAAPGAVGGKGDRCRRGPRGDGRRGVQPPAQAGHERRPVRGCRLAAAEQQQRIDR